MRVNVFLGSQVGNRPEFAELAKDLADALTRRGIGLVYGGASVGLMGILADSMLAAGGEVIGVMPQYLINREVAHKTLTAMHVVETMAERKRKMADLSDAFIALPGGLGTLDEVFEAATEVQLGFHSKPIILLSDYYAALVCFLDDAMQAGLLNPRTRAIVRYASSVDDALAML